MRTPLVIGLTFLIIVLLAGCGHYRLGTTLPADMRTIFVSTFKNTTEEPGIEVDVTNAVISFFQRDGNLRPVSRGEADTILQGVITGWYRRVLAYTGKEDDQVEEYRLYVQAKITFINARTSKVVISGERVEGYTDFFIEGSLPESEEAARPDAFKDLARRIVDKVTSIW